MGKRLYQKSTYGYDKSPVVPVLSQAVPYSLLSLIFTVVHGGFAKGLNLYRRGW